MAMRSEFTGLPQSLANLHYLKDLPKYNHVKPYIVSGEIPADQEPHRTNVEYATLRGSPIFNLRGQEHKLSITKHGFEMIAVPNDIAGLDVKGSQRLEYARRMTEYVKHLLDVPVAFCYDCRFRSSRRTGDVAPDALMGTVERPDFPSDVAHIDHTVEGVVRRVRRVLTQEESERYLNEGWRLRIVNVWRPFGVVQDHDLVFCDFSSVQTSDLLAVDRVSREHVGEVYMLKPRESYDWYWFDHQRPDEAALFLSYDSTPKNGPPYCPHTSINRFGATESVEARESVELRIVLLSPI